MEIYNVGKQNRVELFFKNDDFSKGTFFDSIYFHPTPNTYICSSFFRAPIII